MLHCDNKLVWSEKGELPTVTINELQQWFQKVRRGSFANIMKQQSLELGPVQEVILVFAWCG